jgi:DNA-binding transcriptional ArsR family regulator
VSETGLLAVPPADWRSQFVEEMSGLALVRGAPRAVLRVLGWMVVCEPEEQTASEIQEALGLSAGTVSVAMRTLGDAGVLERVSRPGDRRVYHRIFRDGWVRILEQRFRALSELRDLADRAIAASGGDDVRLVDMRDTFATFETGVRTLLRQRGARGADPPVPGTTPIRGNA